MSYSDSSDPEVSLVTVDSEGAFLWKEASGSEKGPEGVYSRPLGMKLGNEKSQGSLVFLPCWGLRDIFLDQFTQYLEEMSAVPFLSHFRPHNILVINFYSYTWSGLIFWVLWEVVLCLICICGILIYREVNATETRIYC